MLTTREAARLLGGDGEPDRLAAIAAVLGFARPERIGRRAAVRLGFAADAARPRVASGHGARRCLLAELDGRGTLRERVIALARTIAHATLDGVWLLVARDVGNGHVVIAAPAPGAGNALSVLEVDPRAVSDSDADTLAALAAVDERSDLMTQLRWREVLGRDALSRRFYRALESAVGTLAESAEGRVDVADRRTIALLHASRLLFLAFLEAKGWLDRDRSFLRRHFERCAGHAGAHRRLLEPLFFGTLNTPMARRAAAARAFGRVPFLNGGLFARTRLEARARTLRLSDDALGAFIGDLLGRYRLTARETSAQWSDAAVDPEMLGRAFESLMGHETRRAHGAFYTPQPLIARIADGALETALGIAPSLEAIDRLRLLDPACGSGSFLVLALETLADRRAAAGDRRDLATRRRHVLAHSIFGVDIDPTAVWLCQLRLWLSVAVEDPTDDPARVLPLPNLDRNVREGDALAGDAFGDGAHDGRSLAPLRLRYARASGARKRTLGRALDRAERTRAITELERRIARLTHERGEHLRLVRTPDLFNERRTPDAATRLALDTLRAELRAARTALRRLRDGAALPFSFATHFPDAAQAGGFSLVIGNPPWVRPHAVPAALREALRARFFCCRHAAWETGAAAAAAGRGFASQADLAALFVERALQTTVSGGLIALLVPAKLWSALAGGGIRQVVARDATLLALETWCGSTAGFDAAVYPSAILARRRPAHSATPPSPVRIVAHDAGAIRTWEVARASLALDDTPGAPWLLLPPDARAAFNVVAAHGVPLAASALGRPLLGVKTGCNAAFVVRVLGPGRSPHTRRIASAGLEGDVESDLLRPVLRGEHLRTWRRADAADAMAILWTHGADEGPLGALRPLAAHWFGQWRRALERRSDGRGARWWMLFRTDAARTDRPRVVWGDIGRAPRALVLPANDPTVPLNTCYVVRARAADEAHALAALLNSRVMVAWLSVLAEPARGGYRRFLGWTCARLPVPRVWDAAVRLLAPLGRAATRCAVPDETTLDEAVLAAFGLDRSAIAPLLAWHERQSGA